MIFGVILLLFFGPNEAPTFVLPDTNRIHGDYSQCDAVLAILGKHKNGKSISAEDWNPLFASEAYILIKQRAQERQRGFSNEDFKSFVLSDTLDDQYQELRTARENLNQLDVNKALKDALLYLPDGTHIEAKIYVILKPVFNSFVYRDKNDQLAIFLSLYPGARSGLFENKLTHELFHLGFGQCLGNVISGLVPTRSSQPDRLSIIRTVSHLNEGVAMLAAAGGYDKHPHADGKQADRIRWDKAMLNYNSDLKHIDQFLLDLIQNTIPADVAERIDSTFFGYQGPWYTVGWKMSATIESTFGRAQLVNCIQDFRTFLSTYNEAALIENRSRKEPLGLISPSVVAWITN